MKHPEGRKFKCAICGEETDDWGNNPWPVAKGKTDRCCDECNATKVVPARLAQLFEIQDD